MFPPPDVPMNSYPIENTILGLEAVLFPYPIAFPDQFEAECRDFPSRLGKARRVVEIQFDQCGA
jgi:hypothetical protein